MSQPETVTVQTSGGMTVTVESDGTITVDPPPAPPTPTPPWGVHDDLLR